MKRRIIRLDALNWAIQEWQEGGGLVERGRYAGQPKQAKWKIPEQHFSRLDHAARQLFHEIVGELPSGETLTGEQLIAAIKEAEEKTAKTVAESVATLETSFLIGILQERGFKVTAGKKGRTTYVDTDETSEIDEDE